MRKEASVNFRISAEDYEEVKEVAERAGLTVSSFSRSAVLQYAKSMRAFLDKLLTMNPEEIQKLVEIGKSLQ